MSFFLIKCPKIKARENHSSSDIKTNPTAFFQYLCAIRYKTDGIPIVAESTNHNKQESESFDMGGHCYHHHQNYTHNVQN